MRKGLIAAAIAGLALALAGVALATSQFQQFSIITLTAHKAGASTGIKANVYSVDPGALGAKPKPAKTITVSFPARTKFNFGKVKACTYTDKQLTTVNGPSCPARSKIGTGSAVANASPLPGLSSISLKVTAYVRSSTAVILSVTSKLLPAPIVIDQTVSGSKFTIPVPTNKIGGETVVLTKLTLNIAQHGSGKTALITAGKCIGGKFTVTAHFAYVDGSSADVASASACK